MPYRYKHRKRRYRRKRKGRARTYRPGRLLTNQYRPSGFPKTTVQRMRYVENIRIPCVSGILNGRAFRANSIRDPDVSVGAGQHAPMGRDLWAGLYRKYCVLGSKCTVNMGLQPTADGGPDAVGSSVQAGVLLAEQVALPYLDATGIMESKAGQWVQMINNRNAKRCTALFSAKKFFNVKDVKDNYDDLGAVQNADPQKQAYFVIWAQPNDRLSTTTIEVTVTIDYFVAFQEPILPDRNDGIDGPQFPPEGATGGLPGDDVLAPGNSGGQGNPNQP